MSNLKGSERQKMLINYIRDGTVPDGFYVKETKKGFIQFRRIKDNSPEHLIKVYEDKIKSLRGNVKDKENTQ